MRGGKRQGAGRKPATEPTEIIHVRIPIAVAAWLRAKGGVKTAREILDRAFKENP